MAPGSMCMKPVARTTLNSKGVMSENVRVVLNLPTAEELAPLRKKFGSLETKHERGAMDFAYNIVLLSKLNQSWWARYGGKVVLSAFGMHLATDAMLRMVESLEASGQLQFHDAKLRRSFIDYHQRYRGDGVIEGEKVKNLFAEGLPK